MSKGNTAENDMLKAMLTGVDPAWRGNANRFLSLHTADPGEAGSQTTSEATYTGYARVAILRTSGGFTVSGNQISNTALVQFDICTALSNTITHVAVGTASSGAGQVLIKGALNSSRTISAGIQPQWSANALTFTLD
jgi:hypothetical protein